MKINASEISSILQQQIKDYEQKVLKLIQARILMNDSFRQDEQVHGRSHNCQASAGVG